MLQANCSIHTRSISCVNLIYSQTSLSYVKKTSNCSTLFIRRVCELFTHFDRKKPPPPGGFSIYYVPWSRAVCKRFHDEMRRYPPGGGRFFGSTLFIRRQVDPICQNSSLKCEKSSLKCQNSSLKCQNSSLKCRNSVPLNVDLSLNRSGRTFKPLCVIIELSAEFQLVLLYCVFLIAYQTYTAQYANVWWLRLVSSFNLSVSSAESSLFYRALLQKRPIILRSLLIEATPYRCVSSTMGQAPFSKGDFSSFPIETGKCDRMHQGGGVSKNQTCKGQHTCMYFILRLCRKDALE